MGRMEGMSNRGLISTVLIAGLGLGLGRVLGLVRDVVLARSFGLSPEADAAVVLLTLPDVLVSLLVAGGLSAALIPAYHRLKDREGALFLQASLALGGGAVVVAGVLALFGAPLLDLLAPALSGPARALAEDLLPVSLALLPLSVLAGVSASFLNSRDRFATTQLNTAVFNGVIVAALLMAGQAQQALLWLVVAMVAGGLARWGMNLAAIGRLPPAGNWLTPWHVDRDLLGHFLRAAVAGGLLYLFPVAVRAVASARAGEGALASVAYAMKLADFALGISVTVLGLVLFPRLSRAVTAGDKGQVAHFLGLGVKAALLFGGCIAAGAIILADFVTWLVFGLLAGLDEAALDIVAADLTAYARAIVPLALVQVLIHACNAHKDTAAPLWAVGAGLALFAGLVTATALPLFSALALAYALIAAVLLIRLRVRWGITFQGVFRFRPR